MKKRNVVLLLLCLLLCLGITACKGQKTGKDKPKDDVTVDDDKEEVKLEESGSYLLKDGVTEYKIVVPAQAPDMVTEASKELQHFFAEATGVSLEIVTDDQTEGTDAVISLGNTSIAKALGVEVTAADELKKSGYRIKTVEDNILIVGSAESDGSGVLYGVYDFLKDAIGLEFFASDEIVYEKTETVPLYVYDAMVKPTFDTRFVSYNWLREDSTYTQRMRFYDHVTDSKDWPMNGHNQVGQILPYTKEHEDWYTPDHKQLCWSAGEAMETAFANSLIEFIKKNPEAVHFFVGQEDIYTGCPCAKCKENVSADKYGSYAGLQIVFLNNVVEKVEAWREKNAPDREIRYISYAYAYTLMPPVKEDAAGKLVPYCDEVIPADELYIMYAPLEADFNLAWDDKLNEKYYQAAEGWCMLAPGRVMPYIYDINFRHLFLYMDNLGVLQSYYEYFDNKGVERMYSLSVQRERSAAFAELKIYVESKLMWNRKLDPEKLIDDFMKAYYKDAAGAMRKYYDCVLKIYEEYEPGGVGAIYAPINNVYTMEDVDAMDACIKEALQAIEPLRNADNELFKTLYYRIKKEELSSLWLKLSKFDLRYSAEELNDLTLEFYYLCEYYGIETYAEGKYIGERFFNYLLDE